MGCLLCESVSSYALANLVGGDREAHYFKELLAEDIVSDHPDLTQAILKYAKMRLSTTSQSSAGWKLSLLHPCGFRAEVEVLDEEELVGILQRLVLELKAKAETIEERR